MSDNSETKYYVSNQLGLIILTGMEEVIGQIGVNAMLNQADLTPLINNYPQNNQDRQIKFEDLSAMLQALEEIYGARGGRGLALRAGRACFKHVLREYGPVMGFTDLAFRLLPLEEKLRTGIDIFAEMFIGHSDEKVEVDEDDDCFYWKIVRCPICWGRHTDAPVCHLSVGFLQEALYWISGGKFFNVEETECVAMGSPACHIVIEKKSID